MEEELEKKYIICHEWKKNMRKILIVASNYMDLEISSNNRTNFLPQYLHNMGYDVEVVTTNFNHHKKKHVEVIEKRDYKFTVLPEKGYIKNVSFSRLISINSYKKNLKKYLSTKRDYDFVYTFVPPHSIAQIAYKFSKKINAKFIIDIRDLWPEAFQIVVKNKWIYNILFFPFVIQANKTYRSADEIIAVSETYCNRAMEVNSKVSKAHTVFLGTSLQDFDKYSSQNIDIKKTSEEIWLVYAGTLGNSYDLKTVFKAYKIIIEKGLKHIKLLILGSGPLENYYRLMANEMNLEIDFFGRLPYPKMVSILSKCDIVLNPLVKGAAQSIINKHADYAASGLPVISTQVTDEYFKLVEGRKMGFNVSIGDYNEFGEKIELLASDKKLRKLMGKNHRLFAEAMMDRKEIYSKIVEVLK